MAILKTSGFVLKKQEFRETSIIVRFYTQDFGKITCLFKGIRNEPEKFASKLEPFSLNEVIFYKNNRSDLNLASQCDLLENFDSIRGSLDKVYAVTFMLGLIDSLMQPEEVSLPTFSLLKNCIEFIKQGEDYQKISLIFQIKMLSLSGFQPRVDCCVICNNPVDYNQKAFFSLKLGGLLCQKCITSDRSSRLLYRGTLASLSYIQNNELDNNLRLGLNTQIKKELSSFLNTFLQYHLEKELNSFSLQEINHKEGSYV
jgi:DNA repair protein RecO (recombination protein O)